MSNLRDQILEANDSVREAVEVPEWGLTVWVTNISAADRVKWESSIPSTNGKANLVGLKERFLVSCLVDEEGNRIFNDSDADALGAKSSIAVDRLWQVADRLNAVSDKQIESAEEN